MTVAVAAIAEDFRASVAAVAAVVVLLNVAMAFVMPLVGLAVRALGSRRVLVGAGATLLCSSVVVAVAPGLPVLGLARFLQGAGSAALIPVSVQVSTQLLDGERRARALGWWAASNGLGLAIAPLVAGVLLDAWGWRWVTAPVCLLGLALVVAARLGVPADLRHDPGFPAGVLLWFGLACGGVVAALAALASGAWVLVIAIIASILVPLPLVRSRRANREALARSGAWWRTPTVRATSLGASVQMVANGLVQLTVPAWLITAGVVSAGPAAAVLLAMTLTMASMGPVSGRLRFSFERWLVLGLAGCAAGLGGVAVAGVNSWWLLIPALVLLGLGAGCLLSPSLTEFSHTDAGHNAVGLSLFNVLRLSSFAVGGLAGGIALDASAPAAPFAVLAAGCLVLALLVSAGRRSRRP